MLNLRYHTLTPILALFVNLLHKKQ